MLCRYVGMISPDITISNHRLRWAVDGMRFTAPQHLMTIPVRKKFYICSDVSHTYIYICVCIHTYIYIYAYMYMYTLRDGFHQVFTSSASSEALNPLILSATTAIAASSTSSSLWGWVNHNQPCGHMKHMMTNITYQCTIFACYWDIMGWYVYYNI